ncbi:glycosyltransferase family 2 protein [Pectobacterium aroidearum]|uniref:glycosyltransferase family 2 protein n=1 Tax=Pectobacterium aroidearum TaxID=1201031 RepID=UPI0015F02F8A|nr:glycosyltransferase family 2 protein [Pectobacterium aroidearum]MBA5237966.1 glycosyltransferase family 2 protein [Pectobacterium aroidearum]
MSIEVITSTAVLNFNKNINPDISFLIPTYKRPGLLKEAIQSIIDIEDKPDFEIIVVDNDDEKEYADEIESVICSFKDYNIVYYRNNSNLGMYGNWNMSISLAKGRWLTILNDDDKLKKEFIKEIWALRYKANVIIGKHDVFGDCCGNRKGNKNILERLFYFVKIRHLTLGEVFILNPTSGSLGVLFNSSFIKKTGGFNTFHGATADYHFYKNAQRITKIIILNRVVASYRWSQNESLKKETLQYFFESDYRMRKEIISDTFTTNPMREFFLLMLRKHTSFCIELTEGAIDKRNVFEALSIEFIKVKYARLKKIYTVIFFMISLNFFNRYFKS